MKIRSGFVSNSSSSSFIALGFAIKDDVCPYRDIAIALGEEEAFDKAVKKNIEKYKYELEEANREAFFEDIEIREKHNIRVLAGFEDGVGDKTVVAYMVEETGSDGGYFSRGEIVLNSSNNDYVTIELLRDAIDADGDIKIFYGERSC